MAATSSSFVARRCGNRPRELFFQLPKLSSWCAKKYAAVASSYRDARFTIRRTCASWACGVHKVSRKRGEVPSSIFTIPVLYDLDLSWNQLSGSIREFNLTLSKLGYMDLSNNNFSGEVPSSIFTVPVLRYLDLSWNQLSGPIRELNPTLSKLESVCFSYNEFSAATV
ncbi:hypothetical protein EJB05_09920, partial [Eragrostis curvula]